MSYTVLGILLYVPFWIVPKTTLRMAHTEPWLWTGLKAPGDPEGLPGAGADGDAEITLTLESLVK